MKLKKTPFERFIALRDSEKDAEVSRFDAGEIQLLEPFPFYSSVCAAVLRPMPLSARQLSVQYLSVETRQPIRTIPLLGVTRSAFRKADDVQQRILLTVNTY